jgi:2-keto-4-pentenoate hydratase/2-oxohepta-3-ene-1,7-dioic acid hydratase in catechol pathway
MKIICIGRNYAAHAKELNNDLPTRPVIFMKPQTALVQPDKPVYYPDFTKDLHYECELVVKIGRNGKHIQEKFAHKYYSEVSLGIDFTARDVQREQQQKGLPWEIAKAFDGSAVCGSFVALDSLAPVQELDFQLYRNNAVAQNGNTGNMIFTIDKIIASVSEYFTLNTGDLIYTGTPEGVGPVQIGDKLSGTLCGRQLFEVEIK